jgi:nucleotide-binding universal stress UspA family protein
VRRIAADSPGPVLFAYDGSELAASAIAQAAVQLEPGREALVVCVWQPVDVGFTPTDTTSFDADRAIEVRLAAERTAAHGAALADEAGFLARSVAVEATPTWKGIVQAAEEGEASLIVLGPHRRNGLLGHLQGSVAAAVVAHTTTPVLLIPERLHGRAVAPSLVEAASHTVRDRRSVPSYISITTASPVT